MQFVVGSSINSMIELHDGRIACACFNGDVQIWNIKSSECEQTLSGHDDGVCRLLELSQDRLFS